MDSTSFGQNLNFPRKFCRERFTKCKSLYRKDLLGHFGCVNAVDFSRDGQWLVSGGDDRRVLLWNVNKVTRKGHTATHQMKTEHLSNIFCTIFDNETKHIFSAGNDEDVVRHDIERAEAVGHYTHVEAVYCVALPNDGSNVFASAGECGAVFLWDVRTPEEEQVCLAMSAGSFHGVAFNPYETQLIVTANHFDGVVLYDMRKPEVPLIKYGVTGQRESAMFAKFNQLGTQVLSLMRRSGPVLYDLENSGAPMRFSHPEYKNICTLKSPCFVGDTDEYVAAGSDDFNIYLWRNEGKDFAGGTNEDPLIVLKGHRSIVNQIRYNRFSHTIASSGVEKVIKLWSQFRMEGCHGYITEEENIAKREFYSHEQYMQLIVDSGVPLSHDYGLRSVDEDPRMLAFFDSLIQRVNSGWLSDDSSDEETPMEEFLLLLVNQISEDGDDLIQNSPNVLDSLRIFRSNRRLLTEEAENAEEQDMRAVLNRRLRHLFSNETWTARDAMPSESGAEDVSGTQSRGQNLQGRSATTENYSPSTSLQNSQEQNSTPADATAILDSTEVKRSYPESSGSKRKVDEEDFQAHAEESSSCPVKINTDRSLQIGKDSCPVDSSDEDQNRPCTSEATPPHIASYHDKRDNCLQSGIIESKRLRYSNETCSKLNNYDKSSLQNQLSTHLCEKTKYVDMYSDAAQHVNNLTNTNDDVIDYDRSMDCSMPCVEARIDSESCLSCSCHKMDKVCAEDEHQPMDIKRKRFDEACSFDNGNITGESCRNVPNLSKTLQTPISTCSVIANTSANLGVTLSNSCTSSAASPRDNEPSNDSDTRMRKRHGYKKRSYRRSSDS